MVILVLTVSVCISCISFLEIDCLTNVDWIYFLTMMVSDSVYKVNTFTRLNFVYEVFSTSSLVIQVLFHGF